MLESGLNIIASTAESASVSPPATVPVPASHAAPAAAPATASVNVPDVPDAADLMIPRTAPKPQIKARKGRKFMFATGIECSCPVVANNHRVDEMEICGHYEMWERDLELVNEMGIG